MVLLMVLFIIQISLALIFTCSKSDAFAIAAIKLIHKAPLSTIHKFNRLHGYKYRLNALFGEEGNSKNDEEYMYYPECIKRLGRYFQKTEIPTPSPDKIITYKLPGSLVFLDDSSQNIENIMFIRPCFSEVFSKIDSARQSNAKEIVLTGPPGCGKSWCSVYLLWKFVRMGNKVVYENAEMNMGMIVKPKGNIVIYPLSCPPLKAVAFLLGSETIYIFDSSTSVPDVRPRVADAFRIRMSPDSGYNCIPNFSEDEMMQVCELFKVTPEETKRRISEEGLSIRAVLAKERISSSTNTTASPASSLG